MIHLRVQGSLFLFGSAVAFLSGGLAFSSSGPRSFRNMLERGEITA